MIKISSKLKRFTKRDNPKSFVQHSEGDASFTHTLSFSDNSNIKHAEILEHRRATFFWWQEDSAKSNDPIMIL
jgi:hypothetical protein